jgi:plastocyanin
LELSNRETRLVARNPSTEAILGTASSDTGVFNSGTIGPGRSFTFMFPSTGTFPYHCNFHPGMVGSVVVQ